MDTALRQPPKSPQGAEWSTLPGPSPEGQRTPIEPHRCPLAVQYSRRRTVARNGVSAGRSIRSGTAAEVGGSWQSRGRGRFCRLHLRAASRA